MSRGWPHIRVRFGSAANGHGAAAITFTFGAIGITRARGIPGCVVPGNTPAVATAGIEVIGANIKSKVDRLKS